MSPKNFRKICHPEAKILNSLVNCGQTDRRTDAQTRLDVELTPLPVGQLKNFESNQVGVKWFSVPIILTDYLRKSLILKWIHIIILEVD